MGIYLDHAATTYTDERVLEAMLPYFRNEFGNTSSVHGFGRDAGAGIVKARQQTAEAIGASPGEVYFTGGGTESDNWAIKGAAEEAGSGHIITSAVEHRAVLDTCKYLETKGFDVTCLTVGEDGMVSAQSVADAIREDTILVTIMFANNETGTIMPMKEIGEVTKKHGVLFHTDAVQAVGHVPIDVNELGIDLLSMSAHKFYGPKGVGALYVRDGVKIAKLIHGGSHEKGMRSGTLNSAGIVGLGTAIALAVEEIAPQAAHEAALVQRLKQGLLSMPDTRVNGHETSRLPGNINVSFDGIEAEALLLHLDLNGIAVSAGSACSSGSNKPSYVLQEMGLTIEQARAAVRITVGRENTEQEIDTAIETIKEVVSNLRAISPLYQNKQAKSEE